MVGSVDPLRYYDLEAYLFEDVGPQFQQQQSIGALEFFSIVIWKSNRAKSRVATKLLERDPKRRLELESIVRDMTNALWRAATAKERLRLLVEQWGLRLSMASAILAVLWPNEFTVYDVRVCVELGQFQKVGQLTQFERLWAGYQAYTRAVNASVPGNPSLRDKDRFLWAQSVLAQLRRDIARCYRSTR